MGLYTPDLVVDMLPAIGRLLPVAQPYLRKDTGRWAVAFKDPATGKRTTKSYDQPQDAWAFYSRVRALHERMDCLAISPAQHRAAVRATYPLTGDDGVLAAYEKDMAARRLSAGHRKTVMWVLKALVRFAGWPAVRAISAAEVSGFLATKHATTANIQLRAIKAFTRWLVAREYLGADPLAGLGPVRQGRPARAARALTIAEFQDLIHCHGIPSHRRLWYHIAGRTGLRHSEIGRLTWGAIDFEAGVLKLGRADQKEDREDALPLAPALLEALRQARQGPALRLFRGTPTAATFAADLRRAGIEPAKVYRRSLRKTFCTHLALAGAHPQITQKLMRHSDIRLTMKVYTDLGLLDDRAAVAALDQLAPGGREETA